MFLKRLYARHFRNFEEIRVDFACGINEVIGENAQGKTSLLEALSLCFTGSSFRTLHLKDLIKHGHTGFFIEATFEKEGVTHTLALSFDGRKRHVFLNRVPCASTTALLGMMTGVASTPQDIQLINGSPSSRRRFLDLQIAQIDPLYVHHLNRYAKALKQRNALLRQKQIETLFCWEAELAASAAYLVWKRKRSIDFLSERAALFFGQFTKAIGHFKIQLAPYRDSPLEDKEALRDYFVSEFAKRRLQEIAYGMTLVGPHRDDMQILFNERPFRDFASVGQQHLAAISLRLAEWHHLQEEAHDIPLMIIDDFATSLDQIRRELLFVKLSSLGQVFLSSHVSHGRFVIPIKNGLICQGDMAERGDFETGLAIKAATARDICREEKIKNH